jgi:hypothetical protein
MNFSKQTLLAKAYVEFFLGNGVVSDLPVRKTAAIDNQGFHLLLRVVFCI